MGGPTSQTEWIPEDDLLLKNAVEAGASLESLAKGAVCFSQRFSLRQLQDRWQSLLYHSDTSAEASARIIEIECETASSNIIKSTRTFSYKENESLSGKRKTDSVQSHYYAIRKRIHSEPFSSDLRFFVPPIVFAAIGCVSRTQTNQPVDNFNPERHFDNVPYQPYHAENMGLVENKISDGTPGEGCLFGYSENITSFGHDFHQKDISRILGENITSVNTFSDIDLALKMDGEEIIDAPRGDLGPSDDGIYTFGSDSPPAMSEDKLIDFPDMYMDFPDDEDLVCPGGDENDIADTSCFNYVNAARWISPVRANSDNPGAADISERGLGISDAACSKEPYVLSDQIQYSLPNCQSNSVSGVSMPSTSSLMTNTAKPEQEFMICVLNTEDTEIPNNDHVNFSDLSFPPFSSSLERCTKENTGDLDIVKEGAASSKLVASSLKTGSMEVESSADGSLADVSRCAVAELSEESSVPTSEDDPDAFASYLEDHIQGIDHDGKDYSLKATDSYQEEANMQPALVSCLPSNTELSDTSLQSSSDQEERFSDSEDDVPHFSDIESLILYMELHPYDDESYVLSSKASRCQGVDAKNTIRWEQGYHSHINRSILSHGAFAVFYGRHLKYFIRDREVSLGRETEEIKVDINLGREGHAIKISRRQAIIKMDENGIFYLNNISTIPIFVNGKEVPADKRVKLRSCSLVVIRGIPFMFEVNKSAVRSYIMNLQ